MKLRAALLGWLLPAGICAADPVVHLPTGIAFPDDIAGFRRGEATNLEAQHPGFGATYAYSPRQSVQATVYVYAAGQCPVQPGTEEGGAVARHRTQMLGEIRQFAASRNETLREIAQEIRSFATPEGDVAVTFDMLGIDAAAGSRMTQAWLWAARGHFLKVRITSAEPGAADAPELRDFVAGVARLAAGTASREAMRGKNATDLASVIVPPSALAGKPEDKAESELWLLYGLSLAQWASNCISIDSAPRGMLRPSFAAELFARRSQLRMWRDIGKKANPDQLPYAEEMLKVQEAGYLGEYIWQFHRGPDWGQPPDPARQDAFGRWIKEQLPAHKPQTRAGLRFR